MLLTPAQKTALADEIEKRNIYSFLNADPTKQGMELQTGWELQIEHDSYEIPEVKFRGRSLQAKRAIRIPYTYYDKNGNKVREHIVILYEGGDGE